MKIIFSPTKSQNISDIKTEHKKTNIIFAKESEFIFDILKKHSDDDIIKIFKTSVKKTNEIKSYYNKQTNHRIPALMLYSGTSFRQLEIKKYSTKEFNYAQKTLRILSAAYGLLRPFDDIVPHRLDMGDKIFIQESKYKNLYDFWGNKISSQCSAREPIINLASAEYSKMINFDNSLNIINIHFLLKTKDKYTTVAMHAKKQRGKMLDYMIKNNLDNPTDLHNYSSDNFIFDDKKSDEQNYFFIMQK